MAGSGRQTPWAGARRCQVVGLGRLLCSICERVPTCSCPRMMTPPGLMGCQGARFSPVPSFSPSWNASHMPSRVVQVIQMWCHLPSLTNRGSCATCGYQHTGKDFGFLKGREWDITWVTLLSVVHYAFWDSLPCLVSDTPNPTCLVCVTIWKLGKASGHWAFLVLGLATDSLTSLGSV